MKRLHICGSLILAVGLAMTCGAEVRRWELGGGGIPWRQAELTSTAVSFEAAGAIQLVGFRPGDNIVRQLRWSEGQPRDYLNETEARVWDNVPFKQPNSPLVDGDPQTSSEDRFKEFGILQGGRTFWFDLGTRFPVNRIVFYPRPEGSDSRGRPFSEDFIRSYKLQINDGERFTPEDLPLYDLLTQVDFTSESVAEILLPLQFVRYMQLNVVSDNGFEIAEFEVYGAGFAPEGRFLTEIIDLEDAANFQQLSWALERLRQADGNIVAVPEADVRASFRMRTGRDDTPQVFYEIVNVFSGDTQEVSEDAYNRLQAAVRGPVEEDQVNWSEWSPPFTEPGQSIFLPSPRRYFQLEVTLASQSILDGVRVTSVAVDYSVPPLAQQLIGEISVLDDPRPLGDKPRVPAGQVSTFAYDVRADIIDTDVGFDAIEILTPAAASFRDFFLGDPPVSVAPDSVVLGEQSLTLLFPSNRLTATSTDRLRIVFDAQVFVQATPFDARVFDTQSQEAPQVVLPGDANPTVTTNGLRVLTTASSARDLLPGFGVSPRVMTPNGDGINDAVDISYTLVQLRQAIPLEVQILDLAGRVVATVLSTPQSSGAFTANWNGRDGAGNPVPVGIYIVRVAADAERTDFVRLGTVCVAY